ncbi:MAG TPA: hypothetical protein VK009_14850 [Chloroflexota bacterium]|nr:hypothetical protein [Chloroflexota bacterium]
MAAAVSGRVRVAPRGTERVDIWWLEPLITVLVLGTFVLYTTWAMVFGTTVNGHFAYYADPYLSPFYSPCVATNCPQDTFPVISWAFSPAWLIFYFPLAFRLTCYYYRKAYYRSFFWAPPACAVPDAAKRYNGETRFPFIIQNIHRYAFYGALIPLFFLWWDMVKGFMYHGHLWIGVGSFVLLINVILLSLYSFSCHSCRHLVGGYLDMLSRHAMRYKIWKFVSKINEHHMLIAWCSLVFVMWSDIYVRLVAAGITHDFHVVF